MDSQPQVQANTQPSSRDSPRRPRHRHPRGNVENIDAAARGGRRPNQSAGNPALALRPASVAPAGVQGEAAQHAAQLPVLNSQQSRGRGRGSSRGRGRGRANVSSAHMHGRQFGGQLSAADGVTDGQPDLTPASQSNLTGNAPTFQPGQPLLQKTPPTLHKQASKSDAPDIGTRIHEDIDNSQYECAICTNDVRRNSKVWTCRTCWTIFHLHCIKKWSMNQGSAMARQEAADGDLPPPRQWRCPGCNLPKDTLPSTFTCWCEKEQDPKSTVGLPPFSCGQTCSRQRMATKPCPHPCDSICHPGPCPPCNRIGPTQKCFCGKESATRRCLETNYDKGWTCGQSCGTLLSCGEHYCERPCHEGSCGSCVVEVPSRCYCGEEEKVLFCRDRGKGKISTVTNGDGDVSPTDEWTGVFDCGAMCNRKFDCGIHGCEQSCHPQDAQPAHCPRSVDTVSHCPCGKTALSDISDNKRMTCEEPIPNCNKQCDNLLSCGHLCKQICHSGDCRSCRERTTISCRCGRTQSTTMCHQGTEEQPQCMRACRATLNCGRHECGERCCAGERKASERVANKKKLRSRATTPVPPQFEDGFEAEHICTRVCGRDLKCGQHTCQELCHKGPCGSCREAIFDELSCNCGRTILQPPLPCGTRPPPCRFQCERPKSCGHPQVGHNCHLNGEPCPKCPYLTVKTCMCGKNRLKNQQCWLRDVRCGEICGKKLKCGAHRCRKPCHKPGECEDVRGSCQQECGKEKSCGHPCSDICHSPFPCKEIKPCQHKILITCDCQHLKQEAKCLATKDEEGNKTKSLKCDDECARLERNRKLALALAIDPETHTDDHIPYSSETLNMCLENMQWAQTQERELRVFAADPAEKKLTFKPMKKSQRAFLRSVAEDFGFDSQSIDPEPHRHVAIFKTPRFVAAPMKTLAQCARIKKMQKASTVPTATEAAKSAPAKSSNLVGEPYNGFLINNPRFGLTIEDLRAAIAPAIGSSTGVYFDISFLPSDEVLLRAISTSLTGRDLENHLTSLKPGISRTVSTNSLGTLQLCCADDDLNVSRRESDSIANGGWSQVVAKGATPRRQPPSGPAFAAGNTFSALAGDKLTLTKKKQAPPKKQESIVEDWEAAESAEEQKERLSTGGHSDAEEAAGDDGVAFGVPRKFDWSEDVEL